MLLIQINIYNNPSTFLIITPPRRRFTSPLIVGPCPLPLFDSIDTKRNSIPIKKTPPSFKKSTQGRVVVADLSPVNAHRRISMTFVSSIDYATKKRNSLDPNRINVG
ncbi:hypothetical protein ACSL103130_11690 [Actinomyces slackii]|uniref:Uncharacterized protein n=1 Tax=Actinomyces slackii TaxID=52774 RepID=A0A3S4U1S3_9ACTO|nr:Uncharacterised protein [Actinomyces slackii]